MGFFVGLLVNIVLVSVPIGGTLGALFAIRPFENERKVPEVPEVDRNGLLRSSFCDEFHEFAENKIGQNYTINSNEIRPAAIYNLCTTVTKYENGTYPTDSTAPEFSITWSYPFKNANDSAPKNQTQPLIHAFPQASIADGGPIPVKLEDLGALTLGFKWTMGIGDEVSPETSELRLGAQQVNASVALDIYLDANKTRARDGSLAKFEMIIYFAKFGLQHPVGFGNGSTVVTTQTLAGHEFDLYAGKNSAKQSVFSWVATEPVTDFDSDLSPLFNSIINLPNAKKFGVDLPTYSDFVGYVGFGTQAYNAIGDVTFHVPELSIDVRHFGDVVAI